MNRIKSWLSALFGGTRPDPFVEARKQLADLRASMQRLRALLDTPEGRAWLEGSTDPYRARIASDRK